VANLTADKQVYVAALREAREYILDNGDERTMAPIVERIDNALRGIAETGGKPWCPACEGEHTPGDKSYGCLAPPSETAEGPLFEVHRGEHVWRVYEDGRTEGFPDGCWISNRAPARIAQAIAIARRAPETAREPTKLEVALRGLYWDQVDYLTLNKLGGMNNHWMRAAREALGMDPNDMRPSPDEPELMRDSPEIQFAAVYAEADKGYPVNTRDLINALWWKIRNQRRELARRAVKAGEEHGR
jgi:hypothetical protein